MYIRCFVINRSLCEHHNTELFLLLKSTCDVNLLSKLSIIFKEWRVIVLFVLLRGKQFNTILYYTILYYTILYFRYYTQTFFCYKLIKYNDPFGTSAPLFLRNGVTWTFSYTYVHIPLFVIIHSKLYKPYKDGCEKGLWSVHGWRINCLNFYSTVSP